MHRVLTVLATAALGLSVTACTDNSAPTSPQSGRTVLVDSGDTECSLTKSEAPSGTVTFTVRNSGSQVTEFYVYGEDGATIVGEVENIGPGITRDLVVAVEPGAYTTACKPGMSGKGQRSTFTVSDSGAEVDSSAADTAAVGAAEQAYGEYVREQTDRLLTKTQQFADRYTSGQDDAARALYPLARVHWERIETVAESFGDLDPRMDAREADLEPDQEWTGWHRMEKDLWPARAEDYTTLADADRRLLAEMLVADTETLQERVQGMEFSFLDIANGSRALLDEVATGKVTGEEEYWSRTDLYDFQANVDGAHEAFEMVEPVVARNDAALEEQVDDRFAELQELLDAQRTDDGGFVSYDDLTDAEVRALSDAVNALSEPLSRLPGTVA